MQRQAPLDFGIARMLVGRRVGLPTGLRPIGTSGGQPASCEAPASNAPQLITGGDGQVSNQKCGFGRHVGGLYVARTSDHRGASGGGGRVVSATRTRRPTSSGWRIRGGFPERSLFEGSLGGPASGRRRLLVRSGIVAIRHFRAHHRSWSAAVASTRFRRGPRTCRSRFAALWAAIL